ncbi:hypothetical protein HK100_007573 [Physocladia obscura]|uniref:DUF7719 domain-containing protein n=1 Tax=Physocladia obscura TaxID=109957 RepID=A0AAD5X871_9FUNG|nr:hypothetical protein HK100_007573 [Physocladia obscura]
MTTKKPQYETQNLYDSDDEEEDSEDQKGDEEDFETDNDNGGEIDGIDNTEGEDDQIFMAILLSIPLAMVHCALEYAVLSQYSFTHQFNIREAAIQTGKVFVALFIFSYAVGRVRGHVITQTVLASAAAASGVYVVRLSDPTQHATFGTMKHTASVAVVWIACVVQTRLAFSLCGVAVPLVAHFLLARQTRAQSGGAFIL